MNIYDGMAVSATRMIKKFGAAAVVTEKPVTPDTSNPWNEVSTAVITHTDVYVAVVPFDANTAAMLGYGDHSGVPAGHVVGLMAQQDFTPILNMTIAHGSTTYTVEKLKTYAPDGSTSVLHVMELSI